MARQPMREPAGEPFTTGDIITSRISRREGLGLVAGGLAAMASKAGAASTATYSKENETAAMRCFDTVHEGKGPVGVAFFRFGRAPDPANFLIYDIPPGGSEGVHVHRLNNPKLGAYDEYYYIVEGEGQMEIDGRIVPVSAGDHVHTPLEVHHGIENTCASKNLNVFLTYIDKQT